MNLIETGRSTAVGVNLATDRTFFYRAAIIQIFHQTAKVAADIESAGHMAVRGRAVSVGCSAKAEERGIYPSVERNAAIRHHILLVFFIILSKLVADAIRCIMRIEIAANRTVPDRRAARHFGGNARKFTVDIKTASDRAILNQRARIGIADDAVEIIYGVYCGSIHLAAAEAVAGGVILLCHDDPRRFIFSIERHRAAHRDVLIVRVVRISGHCTETWPFGIIANFESWRIDRNIFKGHVFDKAAGVLAAVNILEQAEVDKLCLSLKRFVVDRQTRNRVLLTVKRAGEILRRRPELTGQVNVIGKRDRCSFKKTIVDLFCHPCKTGSGFDRQRVRRHVIIVICAGFGRCVFPFVLNQLDIRFQIVEFCLTGDLEIFLHACLEILHLRFQGFSCSSFDRNCLYGVC